MSEVALFYIVVSVISTYGMIVTTWGHKLDSPTDGEELFGYDTALVMGLFWPIGLLVALAY